MDRLEIIRGTDQIIPVTFSDSNDDAIDITDSTVFFTVKKNIDDADADSAISKSVTSHTSPSEGTTQIDLSNEDTDIEEGNYYFDLKIKNSAGKFSQVDYGVLTIKARITQREA